MTAPSHPSPETGATVFDLQSIALELDRKSRNIRMGTVVGWIALLSLTVGYVVIVLPEIENLALSALRMEALVILVALAVLVTGSNPHLFWGCRRSAIGLSVSESGVELLYPEGRTVKFLWEDSKTKFELDDFTTSSRLRLSTPFFLNERTRLSALSPEAYQRVYASAQRHGRVNSFVPKRSWMFPGVFVPSASMVRGKSAESVIKGG